MTATALVGLGEITSVRGAGDATATAANATVVRRVKALKKCIGEKKIESSKGEVYGCRAGRGASRSHVIEEYCISTTWLSAAKMRIQVLANLKNLRPYASKNTKHVTGKIKTKKP